MKIICVILLILVIVLIYEIMKFISFGPLKHTKIHTLNDFEFSKYGNKMLISHTSIRPWYLSKLNPGVLSKWHTEDFQIPRWSRLHKEIEKRYKELQYVKNN